MAYAIARANSATRNILLLLVILPFWTSFLLRVYAWIGILKNNGLLNNSLMCAGRHRSADPDDADRLRCLRRHRLLLPAVHDPAAVHDLEKMDLTLIEAAADLGCRPWQSFLRITLPLSMPGILAGCLLVFIPAVGEFVIPSLLGDPGMLMIGKVLWTEFFNNRDWPVAERRGDRAAAAAGDPDHVSRETAEGGDRRRGDRDERGAAVVPDQRAGRWALRSSTSRSCR